MKKNKHLSNIPIINYNLTEYGRIATYFYPSERSNKIIYISSLRIKPGFRNKGNGKKLLISTINNLKHLGYKTIFLKTVYGSWQMHWYVRLGFRVYTLDRLCWLKLSIK